MKILLALFGSVVLLASSASPQSLADFARKERERKAQTPKPSLTLSTDEVVGGKIDITPRLDPARKGDLDYLLDLLSHPSVSPELLAAFVPLKDRAVPRLMPLLGTNEPLRRIAPATVLITLGSTEGLSPVSHILSEAMEAAVGGTKSGLAKPDEAFRIHLRNNREASYALITTKFGVWRFTEGSSLAPEQVVERLEKGPAIDVVGGDDNGQKTFNTALRDNDPKLRLAAISLIRVANAGKDFGFQADQPPDAKQNERAVQGINAFLMSQRNQVISQLGTKPQSQ